jgi:hypothetical protein
MNRRNLLIVIATAGFAVAGLRASCGGANAESYLEVRLSAKVGQALFSIEEFGADGKSVGVIRCDDNRGLILFLKRTSKDPAGPKQLRLAVEDESKLESVLTAVQACRAAEFAQIKYYGCVPPGCGIRAGAATSMPRHEGKVFKTEELEKILLDNSTKC